MICECKKMTIFAPQKCFGLWCNGNTADSGPAFPGSSPGSPAKRKPLIIEWLSFLLFCGIFFI